ncbi:hypothetical protein CGMCC3_g11904 [Colletotrichum fructicola]|nr:uncharacterized protein CGMCC3_g11904 [Colletotrichum fructicola]KAE9572150.1 hypothetical protein CGMCC3_g11904 [Colletotrichum fructicola]
MQFAPDGEPTPSGVVSDPRLEEKGRVMGERERTHRKE